MASRGSRPHKSDSRSKGEEGATLGKLTVTVQRDLLDRLRRSAYWSRRPLVLIVRDALIREISRLEKRYGAAKAPPLRPGRKASIR